jgi:hypothetical protein
MVATVEMFALFVVFFTNFYKKMEFLTVELLEEIGLYLDPKSYHYLRYSFMSQLPFVQRVLPLYLEYPMVQELLGQKPPKKLRTFIQFTLISQSLIEQLLNMQQWINFSEDLVRTNTKFNLKNSTGWNLENNNQ